MQPMGRFVPSLVFLAAAWAPGLQAQAADAGGPARPAPVIDTVIVVTTNVFDPQEAQTNVLFRIANAVHVTTAERIVRRELLFDGGDRYDSALVAETERNLRALGVFRWVSIDTVRIENGLAALVHTADGWSTQVNLSGQSTGGTFTWSAGVTERNFLGTANPVGIMFRQEPDRDAFTLLSGINRLFGTRVSAAGLYDDLSDGWVGRWEVGSPFRAFQDRHGVRISGEAASQRVFHYRVNAIAAVDTTRYHRRAFRHRVVAAFAPVATTDGYLRVGLAAQVKREEYRLEADTGLAIPDSVSATFAPFVEFRRANFKVVTHYNGFALQEDLDLSSWVRVAAWLAPSGLGYDGTGIGPLVEAGAGFGFPRGFLTLEARANGLYTSTGLDSGRVDVKLTFATQLVPRQATFLHVEAGLRHNPAPGAEFDLGHGVGPRGFTPHAFTGTRTVWGTVEHRVFLIDNLFHLLGFGFAAFVDYGGAWYPDQSTRAGGNIGFGIRTGSSRATGVNVGRIDLGYRFGDGWTGSRWVLSTGRGFTF